MITPFAFAAAAPITIALPMAVSAAAWVIVALLAVIAWFVRREIRNNDVAHSEMRTDVKKLLEGQGRIEGTLRGLTAQRSDGGNFVAAAAPIMIALPMAISAAAWIIVALLAVIAWFVRRDIRNNDVAHTELRTDVEKLLEGDAAWIRSLLERHPG
ncbi:MAG: hypothetical protein F4018_03090 [Acidobacteria bacterium]|nr:hypothetical protein [Acidobacteriota bacterium]MYH28887.1 hypothetical protein [Acidobacteriota bacterium]MYK87396.1 hypothetical protein [Acidobacteriota bacterium]